MNRWLAVAVLVLSILVGAMGLRNLTVKQILGAAPAGNKPAVVGVLSAPPPPF